MTIQPPGAAGHAQHVVQLYGEDDESLTRAVCRFIADGLTQGDGAVVIATPEHCEAFAARLGADAAATMETVRDGRLVFLDAAETLARLLVDGRPDERRFDEVIGGVVRTVRARTGRPGIRAYGEMVGLLWEAGDEPTAIRLEELWNELLARDALDLFCGYPIDAFAEDFEADRLHPILCAHTHLISVNGGLAQALDRAMDELLGVEGGAEARAAIAGASPPSWGALPRAEATILWLRANLGDRAGAIVERARFYRASYLDAS